jgi:hypothetical protein
MDKFKSRRSFFSKEQREQLQCDFDQISAQLQQLIVATYDQANMLDLAPPVREYLLHGVARRIGVIRRCIENIFILFPPTRIRPLRDDRLADVEISLHAFLINVHGIYDNWALVFVRHHNIEKLLADKRQVGLFLKSTQKYLPKELREYLESPTMDQRRERRLRQRPIVPSISSAWTTVPVTITAARARWQARQTVGRRRSAGGAWRGGRWRTRPTWRSRPRRRRGSASGRGGRRSRRAGWSATGPRRGPTTAATSRPRPRRAGVGRRRGRPGR